MRVWHPLFVHLHIALLVMAFIAMCYWFLKGLATSIFENRIYQFARVNTAAGVFFVVLSMIAGMRDAFRSELLHLHGITYDPKSLLPWFYLKAGLRILILFVYGTFLLQSRKKKLYLQEDPQLMAWCLGTQLLGILLVVATSTIGTMIVYYPDVLQRLWVF